MSWSNLGSSATAVQSALVPAAGSGTSILGVWHRRTCHPGSILNSVIGVIGRIGATVSSWTFRARLVQSSSVASVLPDSDFDSASSRSSSSCPSGG
eukprot:4371908-Pleurochrysis_carterae.AAC.1